MAKKNRGYSVIEVLMVVALTMVGSSAAVVQLKSSKNLPDANLAAAIVMSQLEYAREIALEEKHDVRISFINSSQIQVARIETDGSSTILSMDSLPAGYTYGLPAGVPNDTPESYGKIVDYGIFLSDGALTNDAGTVTSGNIFTIGPGGNSTARAVTIEGASGRMRQYHVKGRNWVERKQGN